MTARAELWLSVLDSRFRVSSDDDRMLGLMRELWAPFVAERPLRGPHDVVIERQGDRWRLDTPPAPPIVAVDPWIVAAAARNGISRNAIAEAGTVPLHAAAAERDGTFVALAGPPEAGKTTLLLDLLATGWLVVTDDLVPLDTTTLKATPFPKPLSVRDPGRWRTVAASWSIPEWLPPPSTVGLVPATAIPHTAVRSYTPSLIFFPRYVPGAEPAFEALTRGQTVARCGENLHAKGPETAGVLRALVRLGAEARGFTLRYGSSEDASDLVRKCLAVAKSME